ncbi:MAG: hypothetical protein U1E74_03300 [Paenacidovorax caeni]
MVFLSYFMRNIFPNPLYGCVIQSHVFCFLQPSSWHLKNGYPHRTARCWTTGISTYCLSLHCWPACWGTSSAATFATHYSRNQLPLFLLIFLGFAVYTSIIYSLKIITRQHAMREENALMRVEKEYLQLATNGMTERIKLMKDVSAQNSRAAHDRRHFHNVLLGLLERGQTREAAALLQADRQATPTTSTVYCENPAINAAVCHYASMAEQAGIRRNMLDIPGKLDVVCRWFTHGRSVAGNTAIHSCQNLPQGKTPYLQLTCHHVGRLLLEIENPAAPTPRWTATAFPWFAARSTASAAKVLPPSPKITMPNCSIPSKTASSGCGCWCSSAGMADSCPFLQGAAENRPQPPEKIAITADAGRDVCDLSSLTNWRIAVASLPVDPVVMTTACRWPGAQYSHRSKFGIQIAFTAIHIAAWAHGCGQKQPPPHSSHLDYPNNLPLLWRRMNRGMLEEPRQRPTLQREPRERLHFISDLARLPRKLDVPEQFGSRDIFFTRLLIRQHSGKSLYV